MTNKKGPWHWEYRSLRESELFAASARVELASVDVTNLGPQPRRGPLLVRACVMALRVGETAAEAAVFRANALVQRDGGLVILGHVVHCDKPLVGGPFESIELDVSGSEVRVSALPHASDSRWCLAIMLDVTGFET